MHAVAYLFPGVFPERLIGLSSGEASLNFQD